jgi:hypothetical protein
MGLFDETNEGQKSRDTVPLNRHRKTLLDNKTNVLLFSIKKGKSLT